jgi:endonuclease YncB( thermonuclease family)
MAKRQLPAWLKKIAYLIVVPSLLLNLYQFLYPQRSDQGTQVIEVLDGDTILLENKVRLRLRHLDAPELEYCGGQAAKDFLEKMVKGKKVIIQEQVIDQQGRPLALIYLGRQLVNLKILEAGLARYHHDQSSQAERLKAAGQEAKNNQLGLYGPECYQTENLSQPDCVIKGNIDASNQSLKRYYFPGCAQYEFTIVEKDRGEQWFCTEKEARAAGYTKAKSCYNKTFSR